MEDTQKNEFLGKIVVVGDTGVGKTSFVKRLAHDLFSPHYKETIGVDFTLKVVKSEENDKTFKLQLLDIAGKERFGNMTRTYFKETVGAFVVVDITKPHTFDGAVKWMQRLKEEANWTYFYPVNFYPIVLVVNKIDLFHEMIDYDEFCKKYNFNSWVTVSSKEGIGFQKALSHMIDICKLAKIREEIQVKINEKPLSIPKPVANPKQEIDPIIDFIRSLITKLNNTQLIDDTKRVTFIRLVLFSVYFDDEPEMTFLREKMKSDAQTKLVIEGIHRLILEKSIVDSKKLSNMMDFLLDCGLNFLQNVDDTGTKKPEECLSSHK